MTPSTTATTGPAGAKTRQQTAQLLVLLYEYVTRHASSHVLVLPAVAGLREAAQLYGQNDLQRAFQKGVDVYNSLMQARQISLDLPLP